ncbi:UbiA prenyltransferase family [Aspergillus tetrazonus]
MHHSLNIIGRLPYHLYTLWLFNRNDMKTMVLPSIVFSYFQFPNATTTVFLTRLPLMLTYTWFNLLAFTINNQCHQGAVSEDALNKPWRPIPAKRITHIQAVSLGAATIPVAIGISAILGGGMAQSILLAALGMIYNSFGGSNSHWLLRNALNAAGFTCFASGTLEVAIQSSLPRSLTPRLCLIFLVVCSTVHSQDMYDQAGDAAAGRRTLPLVIGDARARACIAVVVCFWSVAVCPLYWFFATGMQRVMFLGPLGLGTWICVRILRSRGVQDDRVTFRVYNAWLASLYALPTYDAKG